MECNEIQFIKEKKQYLIFQALQIIEKEISCCICLRIFIDPHSSPCNHYFCFKCISKSLETKQVCPLCKNHISKRSLNKNIWLQNIINWYWKIRKKLFNEEIEDNEQENNNETNEILYKPADFSDQEEDYEDEKIQILDNKDDEYIPYIPKNKNYEEQKMIHKKERKKKGRPLIPITLKELINSKIIEIGEKITYKNEIGIVNKYGYIEYKGEIFKSLSTWSTTVAHKVGLSSGTKKNGWDCVKARGILLRDLREIYEKKSQNII